jgi:putative tryptophan/tyrosine transport system substrate-binding protein
MRRIAAALAVWFCTAVPAFAQDAAGLPLVGVLRLGTAATSDLFAGLLRDALAALGDVDGNNIRLDFRLAEGDTGRFPEMAEALVRKKANVIIAIGLPAARAAQQATTTIPIVTTVNDLVASGLIASLARPGGNITGESHLVPELEAKKLELLKGMLPAARRFGVLKDRTGVLPGLLESIADRARELGIELETVDVQSPADLAIAIASLRSAGAEAVNVLNTTMMSSFRNELGALLLEHKLPAICEWPFMAAAGCLASYGGSLRELAATLAYLTDKVLKGARPADTPAQQPTKFELVINLKVARAIGIEIPQSILARADEVIE